MLEIQNADILDKKNLNVIKKKSKKSQIFLYDTQRRFDDYMMKLKYRRNEKYDDIPHFIILKSGKIYKLFDTKFSSKTFGEENVDKKFIKIALENLGWLNKNTITGFLNNWINDPYRSDAHVKNWRGHYYWDIYTKPQMDSLIELCKKLCVENNIPYQTVPSQGCSLDLTKFKGIVCKSNFQTIYTDINPSFNFKAFYDNGKEENNK